MSDKAGIGTDELMTLILSEVDVGVTAVDRDAKIILWNRFLEGYTGIKAQNAVGKPLFNVFPRLKEEGWDNLLTDLFKDGGRSEAKGTINGDKKRERKRDGKTDTSDLNKATEGEVSPQLLTMKGLVMWDQAEIYQKVSVRAVRDGSGKVKAALITVHDYSELGMLKDRLERYAGRVPMVDKANVSNYRIEQGRTYLVKEDSPEKAYDMFVEEVRFGLEGLVVTRQNPQRLRETLGIEETAFVWLTKHKVEGEICVSPSNLVKLISIISLFMEKVDNNIILLDGIEYLMTQTSFDSTLRFIQHLSQKVEIEGSRLLIPLDPHVLAERDLRLLEKDLSLF